MSEYIPTGYDLNPFITKRNVLKLNINENKTVAAYVQERVDFYLKGSYSTWSDSSGYDDGARSAAINKEGWNITIDYSGEGNFGWHMVPAVPKKNKNYNVGGRNYYSSDEPDYLFIFKRDQDGYFNSLSIKYNSQYMVVHFNCRALSSSYSYQTCYVIEKLSQTNYNLLDFVYKNNENWTGAPQLIHSFKSYYDDTQNFQIVGNPTISNTNLKGFKTDVWYESLNITLDTIDGTVNSEIMPSKYPLLLPNYQHYIENNNNYNIHLTNINKIKKQNFQNILTGYNPKLFTSFIDINSVTNLLNKKDYNLKYFVEGLSGNVTVNIKNLQTKQIIRHTINNDIDNYLERILQGKYEITVDTLEKYKFIINYTDELNRGEIYGTINVSTCGVPFDKLRLLCLRDGMQIGPEYKIGSSGEYTIPNLCANKKYDIILIDITKKIEWKVSSNRSPAQYTYIQYNVSGVKNEVLNLYENDAVLSWEYENDENSKLDFTYLLYSDIEFSYENYDTNYVTKIEINGTSLYLPQYLKNKYYMIETVYRNKRSHSSLIKYDNELVVISFGAEYIE